MSEATGFGRALKMARWMAGMTQRDLARAVELDFTYISKLENGRHPPPSCRSVLRIAAALDCDPVPLLRLRRPVPAALEGLTADQWAALSEWLAGGIF